MSFVVTAGAGILGSCPSRIDDAATDSAVPHADSHVRLRHLLLGSLSLARIENRGVTGFVCACTHYLVFKEPTDWMSKEHRRGLKSAGGPNPSPETGRLRAPTVFRGTF